MSKTFTEYMDDGHIAEAMAQGHQMTRRLICADGTILSVQAGKYHYCYPREDSQISSYDYYTEFEIGFPTKEIEVLLPFAEDVETPTETVYGYVPKDVLQAALDSCGGVVGFQEDAK